MAVTAHQPDTPPVTGIRIANGIGDGLRTNDCEMNRRYQSAPSGRRVHDTVTPSSPYAPPAAFANSRDITIR